MPDLTKKSTQSHAEEHTFPLVPPDKRENVDRVHGEFIRTLEKLDLTGNTEVKVNYSYPVSSSTMCNPFHMNNGNDEVEIKSNHTPPEKNSHRTGLNNGMSRSKRKVNGETEQLSDNNNDLLGDTLFLAGSLLVSVAAGLFTKSVTITSFCTGFTASVAYKYYKRYIKKDGISESSQLKPLYSDMSAWKDSVIDGALTSLTVKLPAIGLPMIILKYVSQHNELVGALTDLVKGNFVSGLSKMSRFIVDNVSLFIIPLVLFLFLGKVRNKVEGPSMGSLKKVNEKTTNRQLLNHSNGLQTKQPLRSAARKVSYALSKILR